MVENVMVGDNFMATLMSTSCSIVDLSQTTCLKTARGNNQYLRMTFEGIKTVQVYS